MRYELKHMKGIHQITRKALSSAGYKYVEDFLKESPKDIYWKSGVVVPEIERIQNLMKMMELVRMGPAYAFLLSLPPLNIKTPKDLKDRLVDDIRQNMLLINRKKMIVKRLPTESVIRKWIHYDDPFF